MFRTICFLVLFWANVVQAHEPAEDNPLSADQQRWLAQLQRPLVVGSEANFRPYAYIDDVGNFSGIANDYLELLAQRLGVQFEVREYPSFSAMLVAARQREIDIVPFLQAARERGSYLDFTQPVYTIVDRILTRKDNADNLSLEDLSGYRVGIIEGYALQAELAATRPDIILVPLPDERSAVRALSLGGIDVLIADAGAASYHIELDGITNLRIAGSADDEGQLAFGVRNDWPLLTAALDQAINGISADQRRAIERRWINLSGIDPSELERLWARFSTFIAAAILASIAAIIWIVSLRRLVARRTAALEVELQTRRRVEAMNERLAVAVGQSAEYILIIDRLGKVEYANDAFLAASGDRNVKGSAFESLVAVQDHGRLKAAIEQLSAGSTWRGRLLLPGAGGADVQAAMTITPIHWEAGRHGGYVATGRDLTQEEQMEMRIRYGEKMSALGTLAGGIAHDVNNLLVPILGYVEIIRQQHPDTEGNYLDAISEAGERARELVQRILTFSSQRESEREPLDLRNEVADSLGFLRNLMPATIEIKSSLGDCGGIIGDRTQIQQIILNLATNASDAMEGGRGTLAIGLKQKKIGVAEAAVLPDLKVGDYAVLSFTDSGKGMDSDTRAKIFDPYFTDKPQGKGTGLGLATVHGIVASHHGAIAVESAPGRGTTIEIYFPVTDGPKASAVQREAGTARSGDGVSLLLVDDDKLVLDVIETMLGSMNYCVTKFSDPGSALARLDEDPDAFDIVLTDLTMPGMTGVQFADNLRARNNSVPIVLMTGQTDRLENIDLPTIGKPMKLRDLSRCLASAMARA